MQAQKHPCFIFAVNHSTQEQDLKYIQSMLPEGVKVIECLGSWKGEQEYSYIVSAAHVLPVFLMAKERNQESVLYLDNERSATLVYGFQDDQELVEEPVGTLREVSEQEAMKHDGWTKRIDSGQYFVVE